MSQDDVERDAIQAEADGERPAPKYDHTQPWASRLRAAPTEWFTTAPPPREWLLNDNRRQGAPGLLPLGKAGMLVAEGGAGKTQLLCQLAIAVATGTPFLDWFEVERPGRVLLAMGEEDAEEMHRRLYSGSRTGAPTPSQGSIVVLPLAGVPCAMLESDEYRNPRNTEFARWFFGYLSNEKFSLVVIDPLSRFAGLEAETDNAQATRYVQATEHICTLTGATVLNSHHINKGSRGGGEVTVSSSRGSSAFTDGHRWVASLAVSDVKASLDTPEQRDRLGEVVTLSFVKSNYSRKGEPMQLRRDERGALLPLIDEESSFVSRVKTGAAEREQKASLKETERRKREELRAAQEALDAEARRSSEMVARKRRDSEDDQYALNLLQRFPEASTRELVATMKGERTCGGTRAHDAVTRAKAFLKSLMLPLDVPGVPGNVPAALTSTVPAVPGVPANGVREAGT